MNGDEDEETQAVANARDALDLVLSAALALTKVVLDHLDEHEAVATLSMEDTFEGRGYEWHLVATAWRSQPFVQVQGHPHHDSGVYRPEDLMRIMGNDQASFSFSVPRRWVELAFARTQEAPCS